MLKYLRSLLSTGTATSWYENTVSGLITVTHRILLIQSIRSLFELFFDFIFLAICHQLMDINACHFFSDFIASKV